jgi:hypothetical protein
LNLKTALRMFGVLVSALTLAACGPKPIMLHYDTGAGVVQPKQYVSSLRFGFVTFQDDRMVPIATGDMKMIGWGGNTYSTDSDIADHVSRSFVEQYKYLGFKAEWIRNPPQNFSFSSRDWVRSLRLQYPNVDVFVIGKIKDYQFQTEYGGFIEGVGSAMVKAQAKVEAYYVNSQDGNLIWGGSILHRSITKIKEKDPLLAAPELLDTDLRRVVLDFANRSVPHLAKAYPGSVQVVQSGPAGTLSSVAALPTVKTVNPNKTPIPAGKGRLVVATTPPGAKVYIDGVFYGDSPMVLDLAPGVHLVKIRLDGYVTVRDKIGILEQQITPWEEHIHKKY